MIRFRVNDRAELTAEGWRFLDLIVERSGAAPDLVSSMILAPDLARELVRQVGILNDVLDRGYRGDEGGATLWPVT